MSDLAVADGGRELAATWTDENPETRAALAGALPVEGDASKWVTNSTSTFRPRTPARSDAGEDNVRKPTKYRFSEH